MRETETQRPPASGKARPAPTTDFRERTIAVQLSALSRVIVKA